MKSIDKYSLSLFPQGLAGHYGGEEFGIIDKQLYHSKHQGRDLISVNLLSNLN